MPTFKIGNVRENPREWQSQTGGPMLGYRMDMQDQSTGEVIQNVEWSRKPTSAAPTNGQEVEGTLDRSGQYGPKFKQAAQQRGGGGGGGRPRDPAERRSIAMQSSIRTAVDLLRMAAEFGEYQPPSANEAAGQVRAVATSMYHLVREAEDDKV